MSYVPTFGRNQMMFCSWDALVDEESIARIIDAFVDYLDLEKVGIKERKDHEEGRPSYNPRGMLKLYIYGSRKGICSSRKLQNQSGSQMDDRRRRAGFPDDFRFSER